MLEEKPEKINKLEYQECTIEVAGFYTLLVEIVIDTCLCFL